jgi:integrase
MEPPVTDKINRNPFTIADQMSLSDVLLRIEAEESLPLQRRRNLCSAIRSLGKLMDKDLSYLPANPSFYRKMFRNLHPERCDLTDSRIRNIKSDVMFALKHVGCIRGARTYMAPLTPEWQVLWETAASAGRLRRYVSRLLHYCSARGIRPDEVNDTVAEQLQQALIDESFVKDPVRAHKSVIRTWNKLVDLVPGWPKNKLKLSNDRGDYSIPLDRFPKPFRDEVDALVDHWSGKDILDDTGPGKPLKPRTIKSRLYRLRQIASALVLEGRNIKEILSLSQIVEIEAAKTALRFYLNRAGDEKTSQIHGLAILIKTLAKHWVKVDDKHLDALKTYCAKVDPCIKGMTPKNRDRLRPLDDLKYVSLLLNFPARQIDEVLKIDHGLRRDAVQVQVALAVQLLLMMPVRAENLANLNLERHIQRTRSGKNGVVHIVIPGEEVKNDEDLEFELPKDTVQLLDLYLRNFHPRLSNTPSPWLFPGGKDGERKTVNTLGEQIKAHVFKATGLDVNMHLFRHIAAKLYLDRNPGGYEVVRRLLGHRSIETTTRFYAGMENKATSRHYDREILNLRDELRTNPTEKTI